MFLLFFSSSTNADYADSEKGTTTYDLQPVFEATMLYGLTPEPSPSNSESEAVQFPTDDRLFETIYSQSEFPNDLPTEIATLAESNMENSINFNYNYDDSYNQPSQNLIVNGLLYDSQELGFCVSPLAVENKSDIEMQPQIKSPFVWDFNLKTEKHITEIEDYMLDSPQSVACIEDIIEGKEMDLQQPIGLVNNIIRLDEHNACTPALRRSCRPRKIRVDIDIAQEAEKSGLETARVLEDIIDLEDHIDNEVCTFPFIS